MKKLFTLLTILAFSTAMFAQVIVGTDPENKNVVLEEYTGLHCVFCPQGHVIAQGIQNAHPDDVILVNIHEGAFAVPSGSEPDYRTQWGSAIAGQAGSSQIGWPSGSVNRHIFTGSRTAMSRSAWTGASNQVLAQPSYLNVGINATIVTSTRQLIVEVEVYYTDNSPESTNYLNVAILQDNILGPQTGGNMGNNYNHMHMLRHLLTGQWGLEITETTTGSLFSKTITYELPEDYVGVDVVLENIDVVAYVSETHQEVISGSSANITLVESFDYDAAIISSSIPQTACADELSTTVVLKNYGAVNLTSLQFIYSVNEGDDMTYEWTGDLAQNESTTVTLPTLTYIPTDNNISNIKCELPNGVTDELPPNDYNNIDFEGSVNYPENCKFLLLVLENPEEITWSIVDENGSVVEEGGPYTSTGFKIVPFTFPATGCYELVLNDATGTGLSGNLYVISDDNDEVLWTGGTFTYSTSAELAYDITIDVNEILSSDDISIHPNPITNNANIEFNLYNSSDINIAVFDILGKNVMNLYQGQMMGGANNVQMNVSGLNEGVYFVKLQMNNQVITKKVMVTKL
ncbi:MAG: Omp28-related outer membrane protein [Bacteroidota bacterium]